METVHKDLSVVVANAEALEEYGHADVAYSDVLKGIEKYDEVIATTGIKRHYPTYARASRLFFRLSREIEE